MAAQDQSYAGCFNACMSECMSGWREDMAGYEAQLMDCSIRCRGRCRGLLEPLIL